MVLSYKIQKICNLYFKLINNIKLSNEQLMLFSLKYGDPNFFDMSDKESIWYEFKEFVDGMLDVKYKDVFNFFNKLSIKYKHCGKALQKPFALSFDLNNKKYVLSLSGLSIEEAMNSEIISEPPELAIDFLHSADLDEYFDDSDDSKNFWSSPPILFHATNSSNYDNIFKYGLISGSETRGLSNKFVGSSVFTSSNPDVIDAYGDLIIKIDTQAMKSDNYMPNVGIEPDVLEGERKQSLAYMIGLDDYSYDFETGIDNDTFIIYGNIPAKYLSVYDQS